MSVTLGNIGSLLLLVCFGLGSQKLYKGEKGSQAYMCAQIT